MAVTFTEKPIETKEFNVNTNKTALINEKPATYIKENEKEYTLSSTFCEQ